MSDTSPNSYNPDDTPKCQLCGFQAKLDEFDSSAWIQYYSHKDKPQGEGVNLTAPQLRWICLQCSDDIGFTQIKDDLIRLQNACAQIKFAGEEGMKCGH